MEIFTTYILPVLSSVISGIVAYIVAEKKAQSEIEKLFLTQDYEEKNAMQKAYSDLTVAIDIYCSRYTGFAKEKVLKAYADFAPIAPKKCKPLLSKIIIAIEQYRTEELKVLSLQLTRTFL